MWDKKDLRSVESGLINALFCWQVADCNIAAVWNKCSVNEFTEVDKKLRWAQSVFRFANIVIEQTFMRFLTLYKKKFFNILKSKN